MLSLFNIGHFSSTVCSAAMAKRIQQESGEERVIAKSRPMMNLTARMPSVVSSSTSSSRGKKWYGNQDPGKSVVVDDRSGQPDKTSWNAVQQVRPHHGDTLLDGNAQSVRYGGVLGNLIISTLKKWQIPKFSSWVMTQQNLRIK